MNKPFFSIIIPTYNHAHLIHRCLDSIVSQTFGNWEAIVVNNFSQDNTIDVVERYSDPRIRLVNNANGGVIAVSRNKGISESVGDWICFLDSDDWWAPNKLEACLPYLEEYDMLYHDMQIYEQDKGITDTFIRCRIPKSPFFVDLLKFGNCCPNSSVVLRKSIIDKVGMLTQDKELVAVEDFDYWLRVSQVTERFCHIGQVLGYYWVGETSISASKKWVARHDALYKRHTPLVQNKTTRCKIIKEFQYLRAVMCLQLGLKSEARRSLLNALWWKNSFIRNIKIIYRLLGFPSK